MVDPGSSSVDLQVLKDPRPLWEPLHSLSHSGSKSRMSINRVGPLQFLSPCREGVGREG